MSNRTTAADVRVSFAHFTRLAGLCHVQPRGAWALSEGSPSNGRAWRLHDRDPEGGGLWSPPHGLPDFLGRTAREAEATLHALAAGLWAGHRATAERVEAAKADTLSPSAHALLDKLIGAETR